MRASSERAGNGNRPVKGVNILVRVRPTLPREIGFDNAVEVLSDKEVVVFKPDAEFASVYDCVFPEQATQEHVYAQLQASIGMALEGYNGTIFAYGQTGTGKTHTMLGPPGVDLTAAVTHAPQPGQEPSPEWAALGVIPRALADLFREAALRSARENVRIQVVASYMEIYNDRLFDLLQPYKKGMGTRDPNDMVQRKALLDVREDKAGNTYVPNVLCVKVTSLAAVMALVAKGNRHRAVRHTEMNVTSSRSHAILQLVVEQWPGQGQGQPQNSKPGRTQAGTVLRSKLNFVDLAGSERWNKEVDMISDRVNELTAINGSLSALATVVAALTEARGRKHVPYRDSKLTHLLQDSLGGNCLTTIVATVSPSVDAFDETVSTLKFADRASAIGNNPVVNTSRDMGSVLALKEREIARLRQMLAAYMQGGTPNALGAEGADPDAIPPDPGGMVAAEQLMQELENVRRALDMERQLRTELEARLQAAGAAAGAEEGESSLDAAGGSLPPRTAQLQLQPSQAQFDYLRVVTPNVDMVSGLPSPDMHRAHRPPGTGSVLDSSSGDPFKAVLNRRAQLGVAGSLAASGYSASAQGTASAAYRGISPARRSGSSAPMRPSGAPWGGATGAYSSNTSPPRAGAQRSDRSHSGALEDAIARIRAQVQELTVLETHNKQRARMIAQATRSARGTGSPMSRNKAKLRSIYGPPAGFSGYKPSTGTSQQRLPTGSSISQYTSGGPGSRRDGGSMGSAMSRHMDADSFDQLLEAAHASVNDPHQSATAVAVSRMQQLQAQQQAFQAQQQALQQQQQMLHAPAQTPPPAMSGGWGRSAILNKFSDTPQEPAQAWVSQSSPSMNCGSLPSTANQQPSQLSPAGSGMGSWGRSALLAAGAPEQMGTLSTAIAQTSLSAPASSGGGGWGRSALLGASASPSRGEAYSDTPQTGPGGYAVHYSPASYAAVHSKPKPKPASPGRFSPGSMIYILGASASSIRAKQMAHAMNGG